MKIDVINDNCTVDPVVGSRLRVYWPDDGEWYKGTIQSFDNEHALGALQPRD
jgi:hypothetical protein